MPNSKQIVYLSQSQYAELIANGTITVNGVTVTYDENDIYVTPQAEPVTDVRINGTSITANGVANIPIASQSNYGTVKVQAYNGLEQNFAGYLQTAEPTSNEIKDGTAHFKPIVPVLQEKATFYGLAKVAGHDEKNSTEPVGTYTPEAKGAIQQMLGVSDLIATAENTLVASKAYAIGDVFTANGKLYKATAAIAADAAIVLQNEGEEISGANAVETNVGERFPHDVQINGASIVSNGIANIPMATETQLGTVKPNSMYGIGIFSAGGLKLEPPTAAQYKSGSVAGYRAVQVGDQHTSTFYGLAKAAGDTTQSQSNNAVGTYTDNAKAAIQHMLGTDTNLASYESDTTADAAYAIGELFMLNGKLHQATVAIAIGDTLEVGTNCAVVNAANVFPHDVQINSTSIVSNGVANIPVASITDYGAIKIGNSVSTGLTLDPSGYLKTSVAYVSEIKAGTNGYKPIVPTNQHAAAFYGLATAAGDTTQSASSNAVGTYTDNAKASIKSMLGIVDGSTGTVDVSGTTPTIAAVENTRYVCGEVTSLDFTPAANGICIVRFTSGSTVTVLTLPSTVKFPEWFDATTLETNTIYEICITDGVYGAVMSWAL